LDGKNVYKGEYSRYVKMLTHGQVVKSLEEIDANVKAIPDVSSSSKPPYDFDFPEYWQFFLTPEHFNAEVYVATLYNGNHKRTPITNHSNTIWAEIERGDSKTCNVPQESIDQLLPTLKELTAGKVYLADDVHRYVHGKKDASPLTPLP